MEPVVTGTSAVVFPAGVPTAVPKTPSPPERITVMFCRLDGVLRIEAVGLNVNVNCVGAVFSTVPLVMKPPVLGDTVMSAGPESMALVSQTSAATVNGECPRYSRAERRNRDLEAARPLRPAPENLPPENTTRLRKSLSGFKYIWSAP